MEEDKSSDPTLDKKADEITAYVLDMADLHPSEWAKELPEIVMMVVRAVQETSEDLNGLTGTQKRVLALKVLKRVLANIDDDVDSKWLDAAEAMVEVLIAVAHNPSAIGKAVTQVATSCCAFL